MEQQANARGRFITVEGIEGVGKTTAIAFIEDYLKQNAVPFHVTREPGGTPIAEEIRHLLLAKHNELMCDDTELLLMFAGRAQHISSVITPKLTQGQWVVCDRFTDASYAYQGGGRGIAESRIAVLEEWVQGELQPDLILLLDAPAKVGIERVKQRSTLDRIESEQISFFTQVRYAYLNRARQFPQRYRIIDANVSLENVQQQIGKQLDEMMSLWR